MDIDSIMKKKADEFKDLDKKTKEQLAREAY